MSSQTLIYIILAGIIALLVALFQYRYNEKKASGILKFVFPFLRFVTIFSMLLLLINPKFEKVTYYNEKPHLVLAVDNSESVSYLKHDKSVKTVLETIRSHEALNAKFDIDYYSFGKTLQSLDTVTFTDKQTDITSVFKNNSQVYKASTAPMVLITDGNQTFGSDYEFASQKYEHPVFPIILGDTVRYADIKLQQLNVNKYAFLKNKFPIEVIATYNGDTAVNSELKVTSGNTVVFRKVLKFSKTDNSQVVQFTLPANRVGVRSYRASIAPLTAEKNTLNNTKEFAVEVINQKTNVAIVSEILHPDIGALKKSIEQNEQRTVYILNTQEFISKPNDFQLVIVYQPNQKFKRVFEELKRLNSNTLVVTGSQTNWSFLNTIQDYYKQTITNQSEEFQASLNTAYSNFIIDNLAFESFPPLLSEFGELTFNTTVEPIIFKRINDIETNEPLLVTLEDGKMRNGLLLGENIWKWRAQSYLNQDTFNAFDNFISKLIQYLASSEQKSRLNVTFESFYNGSSDINITAQFFNKNFEFDSIAQIQITLKNKEIDTVVTRPFILKNTVYQVDLSGLSAGSYDFTVSANNGEARKSGQLKILDYNVEQQFLNANVTKLQRVATNSNGKSYFIDDATTIINDLINDNRFATIQKSNKNIVPLIDFKYLLAFMALSLALEWFIRKYNGLI